MRTPVLWMKSLSESLSQPFGALKLIGSSFNRARPYLRFQENRERGGGASFLAGGAGLEGEGAGASSSSGCEMSGTTSSDASSLSASSGVASATLVTDSSSAETSVDGSFEIS